MGRINNSTNMFNTIVNNKQDMYFSDYSKHLETKPILVTYYNQNLVESTADAGLQEPYKLIGENSPLHFNKITGLPLYSVPLTNLGLNFDDKGPHIDFEADGVIPPGIIEPKPYDFLIINYLGQEYLFKVTEVNFDTIRSNNYYKITFHYSKNNNGDIDKSVTEKSTVVYDDIGSKSNKCLLLDEDYKECNNLMELSDRIIKLLVTKFWDRDLCYFLYREKVYDPWLNFFIKQEKLLKDDSYDNEIYVQKPCVNITRNFLDDYEISFFSALKEKNKLLLDRTKYVILHNTCERVGTPFVMNCKHYKDDQKYEIVRIDVEDEFKSLVYEEAFGDIEISRVKPSIYLEEEFIKNINDKKLYEDPNPIEDLKNTVIIYFKDEKESFEILENKFLNYKKYHDVNPSFTTFITLFSFLFVVRENINRLRKKQNI